MQEQSRQTLLPGLKPSYGHPPYRMGAFLTDSLCLGLGTAGGFRTFQPVQLLP